MDATQHRHSTEFNNSRLEGALLSGYDKRIQNQEVSAKQTLHTLEAATQRSPLNVDPNIVRNSIQLGLLEEIPQHFWDSVQQMQNSADELYRAAQKERDILKVLETNLESQQNLVSNPFQAIGFGIDALFGGNKGESAKELRNKLYSEVEEQKKLVSGKEMSADLIQRELDTSYDVHLVGNIPVRMTGAGRKALATLQALKGSLDGQSYSGVLHELNLFDEHITKIIKESEKLYSALLASGFERDDEALQTLAITIARNPARSDKILQLLSTVERDVQSWEVDGKKKLQLLQIIAGKEYPEGIKPESLSSNASRTKVLSKMIRGTFASYYVAAQLFGVKESATSVNVKRFDHNFDTLIKKGFKHASGQGAYLAARLTLRPNSTRAIDDWQKAYTAIGGVLSNINPEKVQAALILSGLPGGLDKNVTKFKKIQSLIQSKDIIKFGQDSTTLAAQLTAIPGDPIRVMFLYERAHKNVAKSWITTNQENHSAALIGGAMMELIRNATTVTHTSALMADNLQASSSGYLDTNHNSSIWFFDSGSGSLDGSGSFSGFESLGGYSSGDSGFSAGDIGGFSDGGAGCGSSSGSSGASSCGSSSGGGSSCGSSGGSSCGGGGCGGGA